jgi:pimeloyl-ACP methyl ester carboxylesterase
LWPFRPRWFASRDGRMHYIDEGPRDGRPVALVHGNPTWGLDLWHTTFPHANVVRLPDAGNYLQEDAHELIVPALLRFLGSPS